MPGAPTEVLRLWQWHAIEEVEHKAVAYDTFFAVTRELSAFRRWALRCHVMLLISLQFWYSNFQRMADFFRQDGINTPRTWWRVFTYLWFKPGMMRKVFVPWLSFFRPGFHPWDHDDGALVREFEQRLRALRLAALRLVEVAERAGCPRAMLVERASEIDWGLFEDIRHLGVTAGASAPQVLVDDIIDAFAKRFDVTVETVTTAEENIAFKLPRPLRDMPAA